MEKLGKLVSQKFEGRDSYYIVHTNLTEDIIQSQEPIISYTPSTASMKQVDEDAADAKLNFTLN